MFGLTSAIASTVAAWVVAGVQGVATPAKRATVCNGHAELCDRSYGNITFIGAHDSYAYSTDALALARNQEIDITTQLDNGVRMLQTQGHLDDGVLHFCHTSCLLFDYGPVSTYLSTVATWLAANPTEVVTFLFTNPDDLSVADVWAPLFVDAGLDTLAFVPTDPPLARTAWPTLGDMLDDGKQLVVFMDYEAEDAGIDYILPEFEMIWEPPYDSTDDTFPCSIDRVEGPLSDDDHMYLLNHFLDVDVLGILVSDPEEAATTNGVDSIMANANGCASLGASLWPSFVLLDFVDLGDPYTAADIMNGFST